MMRTVYHLNCAISPSFIGCKVIDYTAYDDVSDYRCRLASEVIKDEHQYKFNKNAYYLAFYLEKWDFVHFVGFNAEECKEFASGSGDSISTELILKGVTVKVNKIAITLDV
jgi:hypothetical protein